MEEVGGERPREPLPSMAEGRSPSKAGRSAGESDAGGNTDGIEEIASEQEEIMSERLSLEDVSSLLEPILSLTATRYKSAQTPAIEKVLVLEENSGFFEDGPLEPEASSSSDENLILDSDSPTPIMPSEPHVLSLGKLPSQPLVDPEIPVTPWHAGPKKLQIEKPAQTQSSLQGVFSNRARSLSGGAEALKKMLPKGLPSMAQVGSLFSSSPLSPSKPKFGFSTSQGLSRETTKLRKQDRSSNSQTSSGATTPRFESILASPSSSTLRQLQPSGLGVTKPKSNSLRRVNSDESVLYHSLSRASSLGDDSRFENQREMVNSRAKAIRDSFQDRSSFRMPQMLSLPNLPNFGFNMNFLNSNSPNQNPKATTDSVSGTSSGNGIRNEPRELSSTSVATSMPAGAATEPDISSDGVRSGASGRYSDLLERAMENLTGDIVIMGGYRGSVLRATKTNRQVWVPVKVGLNIRKVDLEVGLEPEDEEQMEETIYPSGMLQNIGPVDISRRLFRRLNECDNARKGKLRVWDFGYDWRLSPHLLSRKLTAFLKGLLSCQPGGEGALVMAHSLGGLITRHVANLHPELFSGIIFAGVPHSCVNILGPLRNGDAVLLSSRVLTAQVNFTLRTSFLLLPEDGECFVDIKTKEKYPLDFFNVEDWIKYRLSPCTDPPFPPRNSSQSQGSFESLMHRSNQKRKSFSFPSQTATSSANSLKPDPSSSPTKTSLAAEVINHLGSNQDRTLGMQMDSKQSQSVSTTVTIPRDVALKYLTRVLAEIKTFKKQLHHNPGLTAANRYPPLAVIYGKSIPTVSGAKVDGREGIPCSDSYDNLAFASGDGVCLAKEAMLPQGYKCVSGGRISSDRGHVTLLGDLNAVGRAIEAVVKGRRRGIGLGLRDSDAGAEAYSSTNI